MHQNHTPMPRKTTFSAAASVYQCPAGTMFKSVGRRVGAVMSSRVQRKSSLRAMFSALPPERTSRMEWHVCFVPRRDKRGDCN